MLNVLKLALVMFQNLKDKTFYISIKKCTKLLVIIGRDVNCFGVFTQTKRSIFGFRNQYGFVQFRVYKTGISVCAVIKNCKSFHKML